MTVQKESVAEVISIPVADRPIEDLLTKEWLLTNSRGGYASSTVIGCNTRRYHGLLIGSVTPLANRIMGLSNCLEMVIVNGRVFNLSTFEFSGKFAPQGFQYIERFGRGTGVHFHYRRNGLKNKSGQASSVAITKSVYLPGDSDTVALIYEFTNLERLLVERTLKGKGAKDSVDFVVRPFVGLRDFHGLQKSYAPLCSSRAGSSLLVYHDVPGSCELSLSCPAMKFSQDPQWWFNFVYRVEQERGQDFTEDLWSPGFFKCRVDPTGRIVLRANLRSPSLAKENGTAWAFSPAAAAPTEDNADIEGVRTELREHRDMLIQKAKSINRDAPQAMRDMRYEILCLAADQFVAGRQRDHEHRTTILAGFPWFADWGRDAFISLEGLLLSTGRFEQARSVLTTFARAADEGMIPNRFDDYSSTAYFNSIDASLWFIHAAFQYLSATGDSKTFTQELLPTVRWIVDSFQKGTRFGICADSDGLVTGGSEETQLTWMDAKFQGTAFTPRYGKAVEINALWYNNLCCLARFYQDRDTQTAERFNSMSRTVAESFCGLFWNEAAGYLNDCILPDGSPDASLRPNQIFAVSLPFSALSAERQKRVVGVVQDNLLTPYGLRTLNVEDNRYRGEYTGPQRERDEAYHQGTVWPYLIGPFVQAYLKVNNFSQESKSKAAEFIEPLLQSLTEDGCLGQVSEIYDGNAPHRPKGCFAQAWSVAELIRAYQLINS